MEQPIVFTPTEMFTMIVAICGAIVTVAGAVTVIAKAVKKVNEPQAVQNDRIAACEQNIADIYRKFIDYDSFLKRDKRRLEKLEDGNEVVSEALLALLSHAINGNDTEGLVSAKNKLNNYLIRKDREED